MTQRNPARKFRKKPVVIEAVQWKGDNEHDVIDWFDAIGVQYSMTVKDNGVKDQLSIVTLEGDMLARPGWWIIRGVAGEFYPCEPGIFNQTYDEVIG